MHFFSFCDVDVAKCTLFLVVRFEHSVHLTIFTIVSMLQWSTNTVLVVVGFE